MSQGSAKIKLIINADDFGYFRSVSQGIIEAAQQGAITATGVMANSPLFDEQIEQLKKVGKIDLGVHLNVTHGSPLTERMRNRLANSNGQFPSKFALIKNLVTNQISITEIADEWRAQIVRCVDVGLELQFLNSHEHLHMFPPLFRATQTLAAEFGIPHIRFSAPEIKGRLNIGGIIRNATLFGLNLFNRKPLSARKSVRLIGMNESGNLSMDYFRSVFPSMKRGSHYELMCHPGHLDTLEINSPELLAYHHWESELALLTGADFMSLCQTYGVELVRYSDLD